MKSILAYVMKSEMKSTVKGWVGEALTRATTWALLDKTVYRRLHNVILPKENGMTTQIDHIIVSPYGIFVIETKNYKGWIFGSEKQEKWTQVLSGGRKFQFYNPIRQNYGHVKTLAELLGLDENCFHSIIWFNPDCEIKTPHELPTFVMNRGLISYIKNKTQPLLNEEKIAQILSIIQSSKMNDQSGVNSQHRENVKRHIEKKQNHPTCPHCQSPMVKRTAKKGNNADKEFWGCSRYPQCRGTRNMQ